MVELAALIKAELMEQLPRDGDVVMHREKRAFSPGQLTATRSNVSPFSALASKV